MSVVLIGYSVFTTAQARNILNKLQTKLGTLFTSRYITYIFEDATDDIDPHISELLGKNTNSKFLIAQNDVDMNDSELAPTLVNILKISFGTENVVILSNGVIQ